MFEDIELNPKTSINNLKDEQIKDFPVPEVNNKVLMDRMMKALNEQTNLIAQKINLDEALRSAEVFGDHQAIEEAKLRIKEIEEALSKNRDELSLINELTEGKIEDIPEVFVLSDFEKKEKIDKQKDIQEAA